MNISPVSIVRNKQTIRYIISAGSTKTEDSVSVFLFLTVQNSKSMEALGLPCLKILTVSRSRHYHDGSIASTFLNCPLPSRSLKPRIAALNLYNRRSVVRMVVDTDDYDLKQMRDMAAARKRWDALIRNGKVKVLTPREAGYAIQLSDKPLLDVRPSI